MRLHAVVHDAQLCLEPIDVVFNISLQTLNLKAVRVQGMEDRPLLRVHWPPCAVLAGFGRICRTNERLLAVLHQAGDKTLKVVAGQISDCLKRRRLEFLEAGVIEDLADTSLQCSSTDPRRH